MTELQKEFLRLYVVYQLNYKTVSEQLNIPKETLSKWYSDLKAEREIIAKIRNVWTKKKFTTEFEPFYQWYISKERRCEYCDISEDEINTLLLTKRLYTKRIGTRGKTLEFDRKEPDLSYSQLDNIVLCCYWCNNSKTDTFTYNEFKTVGKVFSDIWKNRLNNKYNLT